MLLYSAYDVPWSSFVATSNVNFMKESIVRNRQSLFFFKIQYYFNLIVSYRPPFNMMGLSFCNVLTSVSMIYVGGLGRLVRSSLEETVWCGFTFSYIKSQGTITKALPSGRANLNIDYLCCESYSQMMYITCLYFIKFCYEFFKIIIHSFRIFLFLEN